jgi:hypothetical protein
MIAHGPELFPQVPFQIPAFFHKHSKVRGKIRTSEYTILGFVGYISDSMMVKLKP